MSSLEQDLLREEDSDEIPLVAVKVNIPSEFIHQRLVFFLEMISYCLNHKNTSLYQQDCKANLLSIWENIIKRVFASLEEPQGKAEALRSIKQLVVFPFSYRMLIQSNTHHF